MKVTICVCEGTGLSSPFSQGCVNIHCVVNGLSPILSLFKN